MKPPDLWTAFGQGLLLAYLLLILFTFTDYGIAYDEDWHATYGEHIVQWYRSGFQDDRALTYWTLPLQGGFAGVVERLAVRVAPWGAFETAHLVNALFAWLGVAGTFKLARHLGGPRGGFLSALFLVMTPRYYGHAFNNVSDIPFASLTVWALYFLVTSVSELPRPSWASVAKLGVVLGLALATRPGAAVLVGYLGAAYAAWFLAHAPSLERTSRGRTVRQLTVAFLLVGAVAYVVMLAFWPAAQLSPFGQPARGLLYATRFRYTFDVFFEGRAVANNALPWHFLPKLFLITLPEYFLLALGCGVVLTGTQLLRRGRSAGSRNTHHLLGLGIVLLSALFPIGFAVITRPANYDEVRHFLFTLPSLAVLAGLSVNEVLRRSTSRWGRRGLIAATAASMMLTAGDMGALHPYQYVYFNRLFGGGLGEAARSYETEYWGTAYKEAAAWLTQRYPVPPGGERIKVASCLYALSTSYYLPNDRFEYLGSVHDGQEIPAGAKPDVFFANPRWGCDKTYPGEVVHTVARQGVPLASVIQVSRP